MRALTVAILIALLVLSAACSSTNEPSANERSAPADYTVLEKIRGTSNPGILHIVIWLHGAERRVDVTLKPHSCWDARVGTVLPLSCR